MPSELMKGKEMSYTNYQPPTRMHVSSAEVVFLGSLPIRGISPGLPPDLLKKRLSKSGRSHRRPEQKQRRAGDD